MAFVKLFHNEEYSNKKDPNQKTNVSVEYYSIDREYNREELQLFNEYDREAVQLFDEYMINEFDYTKNDIVDIVSKIREITKRFPESKLKVSIKKEGDCEEVYYERGYFISASVSVCKKDWGNYINNYISMDLTNKKGISIAFENTDFLLSGEEEMNRINQELKPMYDKIIKLRNLARINAFLKEIETLKKRYIDLEMDGFIEYLNIINDYREIRLNQTFFEEVGFIADEENHTLKLGSEKKKKASYSKVKQKH